ncbi:MAG: polyphosphate kinase 1 [Capsulimonadaceae bacterium]
MSDSRAPNETSFNHSSVPTGVAADTPAARVSVEGPSEADPVPNFSLAAPVSSASSTVPAEESLSLWEATGAGNDGLSQALWTPQQAGAGVDADQHARPARSRRRPGSTPDGIADRNGRPRPRSAVSSANGHSNGTTAPAKPAATNRPASSSPPPLDDPALYLNRELSWLSFNDRVFAEMRDLDNPLLERLKFLAIGHSNLDEYYMVRVSGIQQHASAGLADLSADGLNHQEQLDNLRARVEPMLRQAAEYFKSTLNPELRRAGIRILEYDELSRAQRGALRDYFKQEIFPVLTPLALGPGHPFPHISSLSLNLAVVVRDPEVGERFARMKVPGVLPRFVPCPPDHGETADARTAGESSHPCYVWLEQVIAANLQVLFPGLEVVESQPFRVTRDADIELQEDEASDLLSTVEQGLQQRQFGDVCRLELNVSMHARLREMLVDHLRMDARDVYAIDGPLGLSDLMQLMKIDRPDLKFPSFVPVVPPPLDDRQASIVGLIGQHDLLLHHPYDSFAPVIDLIATGSRDAAVLAIKQTLYRVGSNSPIVKLLADARDDDTQVAVLVELKARFDEENNIEWARALEDAGVHVVYGLVGLKTHCKVCLLVRKERDGKLRRYVHLGTGNYNPTTARAYTDVSFFTARDDIAADVSEIFNLLTGYSHQRFYRKLLVAPVNLRQRLTELIEREAENARNGRPARMILKTNTLSDEAIIRALYGAAQAGVRIDLIVRGVCCLRPGVVGVSENIRVVSIVGRFLEHSRIYYFENGGDSDIYMGSADLMRRNLDRRVEILFPVEDPELRRRVKEDMLEVYLRDTKDATELLPDGHYVPVLPPLDAQGHPEERFSAQEWFLAQSQAVARMSSMRTGEKS